MQNAIRRYVTGLNANGRSTVVDIKDIKSSGGAGNFNLWMTGADLDPVSETDVVPFFPRQGQTIFRVFHIPPAEMLDNDTLVKIVDGFFAAIGDPACKVDTSRHPLMHTTPTLDYVMLLSGHANLLLDEGDPVPLNPLDVVVQRGVNHMWVNTGNENAVFLAVMLGR